VRRVAFAIVAVGVVLMAVAARPAAAASAPRRVAAAPIAFAAGPAPIGGGGSSFAQLEIEQWRADVARPPYSLKVDYQAAGSTFGRQKYLAGQLDFGQSDITFQPEEANAVAASPRRNFVYVPISAGGLGFMYNLTGKDGQRIKNLKLSQESVCRAFTEDGIYWDDPAIVAENSPGPGPNLPHEQIHPVVRSDGSGTSYVFSAFCIANVPAVWQRFISLILQVARDTGSAEFLAGRPTSQWPSGYGQAQAQFAADGVADFVANDVSGRNAITYNEAGFAIERGLPNAAIRNAAGVYHTPDAPNVSVALAYATGRPDGTFTLNYTAPDPDAYFPSTYSYTIAQTTGFDPAKGATLATFLNYAVTKGQERAVPLGYARLSTVLVNLALDQIVKIPGAPPRPTNLSGAPPPPRATTGGPVAGSAGAGSRAAPGAVKGATAGAAKPGANGGTDPVAAPAGGAIPGAVAGAAGGAAPTADGTPAVDVSNLPTAEVASRSSASEGGDLVSDKEALWMFALGFALVGIGTAAGTGSGAISRIAGRGGRR